MLKIHETTTATGELSPVFLRHEGGVFEIVDESGALELPHQALDAVMARFGVSFDPEQRISVVAVLDLGSGRRLRHVRHLAGYDVIARDYLVYEGEGEPLAALATTVAAALGHLARASSLRRCDP